MHKYQQQTQNYIRNLSREIQKCDSLEKVLDLLEEKGLNQRKSIIELEDGISMDAEWKYVGNNESNLASVTSNTAIAIQGLTEMLVNGADAMQLRFCAEKGIDPMSGSAPCSPQSAREYFLGLKDGDWGNASNSEKDKFNEMLMVMENKDVRKDFKPNISFLDKGCGQEPSYVEDTFCDDSTSNKLNINFLGGKYSRGGLSVFNFLEGKTPTSGGLRVILTKACPATRGNKPNSDCWSLIIQRMLHPGELKHFAGIHPKMGAIMYLTINNEIPHFSDESISLDMGEVEALMLKPYKKCDRGNFETLEFGTWVRLFKYNLQAGQTSAEIAKGFRTQSSFSDIMKLGPALQQQAPYVSYPWRFYQPLIDKKLMEHLGRPTSGCVDSPLFSAYGFLHQVTNDANSKGSCGAFYQNSLIKKGNGTAENPDGFKYPTIGKIKSEVGNIKVYAFLLNDVPPTKKDKNGNETENKSYGKYLGFRGITTFIGDQYQQIECNTLGAWGTDLIDGNIIIFIDMSECSVDAISAVSDVSRAKLRKIEILKESREKIKEFILELPCVQHLKKFKSDAVQKDSFGKKVGLMDRVFDRKKWFPRSVRKGKGRCLPSKDGHDNDCNVGSGLKLSDEQITEVKLVDNGFANIWDNDSQEVISYKKVNKNTNNYYVQLDTDGSEKLVGSDKVSITLEESPYGKEVWTQTPPSRGFSYGSFKGRITCTMLHNDCEDRYDERIVLRINGETFNCPFSVFPEKIKLSNTKSPKGNRTPSQLKQNKQKFDEIKLGKIGSNQVSSYYVTFVRSNESTGLEEDYIVKMTSDDLIGFSLSDDGNQYVLNLDCPAYKKAIDRAYKDITQKANLTTTPKDEVEHEFFLFYQQKVNEYNSSLKSDSIDTSYETHTIGTNASVVEYMILESFRGKSNTAKLKASK